MRRALPRPKRRTIGRWCFVDHLGPADVSEDGGMSVGPHPHSGIHTVTWLIEGELHHRDSLASLQRIRPGEVNLMSAGYGIAHAEERVKGWDGTLHGVQLWLAQTEDERHGPSRFMHLGEVPRWQNAGVVAREILGPEAFPARADLADVVALDVELVSDQPQELPLVENFEHGFIVLRGEISLEGTQLVPGVLGYLPPNRNSLHLRGPKGSRALLIGGIPFAEKPLMWWNFVGRTRGELLEMVKQWNDGPGTRYGSTGSSLPRILSPVPPWRPESSDD
ncbi:MAG: pirin family protein [Acidimicrobiales bacterium]